MEMLFFQKTAEVCEGGYIKPYGSGQSGWGGRGGEGTRPRLPEKRIINFKIM